MWYGKNTLPISPYLASFAKWLRVPLRFKLLWVWIPLLSLIRYSQHSSIIWPVWLNGWVFVHELNSCGFESRFGHLSVRCRACFEEEVPSHSNNCRLKILSKTRMWHDKNTQSNSPHWASLAKCLSFRLWTKMLLLFRITLLSLVQISTDDTA